MTRARACAAAIFIAVAAQGAPADADEAGSAAALFEEGLKEMQAEHWDSGCPKLAESYWLDARPGVLFTLAECEAKAGKLASAVAHYEDYLRLYASMPPGQQAVQRDRLRAAEAQRTALSPRVPTLTIVVPTDAPDGLVVRRDDVTLGAPSLGVSLPVDPGKHVVTATLPNGATSTRTVNVAVGAHDRLELELPVGPAASGARDSVASPSPPARSSRPLALVIALGGAAAGTAIGAVAGGLAIAKKGEVDAHCNGTTCDPDGKRAADQGKTLGWASTVALGTGALAGGAALALWLTTPKPPRQGVTTRPIAAIGPGGGLVGVAGGFR